MADEKAENKPASGATAKEQTTGETLEQWGDAPATIKKAIRLNVALYLEGEDAPSHNFADAATQAVRDIIAAGSAKHPELKITIKKISEK